jgi:hypothetical protein
MHLSHLVPLLIWRLSWNNPRLLVLGSNGRVQVLQLQRNGQNEINEKSGKTQKPFHLTTTEQFPIHHRVSLIMHSPQHLVDGVGNI